MPGDDLLELNEVEEEGIVAHSGERRHAGARGDDGARSVGDGDRGRLGPIDDAAGGSGHARRARAAEVHHLVSAVARHECLNHQIFDRVPVVVDLPLVQHVGVKEGGARFGRGNEAGHGHRQDDVVRVSGAAKGVQVGDVGGVVRGKQRTVLVVRRLDPTRQADGRSSREQQAPRDHAAARPGCSKAEHGSFLLEKRTGVERHRLYARRRCADCRGLAALPGSDEERLLGGLRRAARRLFGHGAQVGLEAGRHP